MKRLLTTILLTATVSLGILAQSTSVIRYAYTAKFLKSKITALIWYEEDENGDLSGEIIYTSSKHQTPIRVFGRVYDLGGTVRHSLFEYQADGEQSGHFEIDRDAINSALSGQWGDMRNDDSQRRYTMRLTRIPFPEDKGGAFTPAFDIQGKYVYNYQHHFKGNQGGSVVINHLKGDRDKKYVHISKYDPQIAEYEGNLIPQGNIFSTTLEECGYSFTLTVYNDFVRVRTTSSTDKEYDCFGAFTTLDGFYLKVSD